ncbi:MAG: tetraacyldisaccharide 4'-kinase [Candidatus Omnitrophica bacterium]|nr:tetraacyldisaccharide 4'-kinase [Candidatus Omnitrophota bacterium]
MNDERKTIDGYIVGAALSIISFVYFIILKFIYFLYAAGILSPEKVSARVISAGNITLGGTGKTPFVIMLAEKANAMGRKVAVLTRGYGDDELHLLKERLGAIPVVTGANRAENARYAIKKFGSDCIILDDGFQHHRLKRDLDIVLIDATSPFGNMKLFPRGVLREPLGRLKNADMVVLTKSDMGSANLPRIYGQLKNIKRDIKTSESFYKAAGLKKASSDTITPLSYIKGRRVVLVAGIANPEYFEWMVKNLGAVVTARFYYADHHLYSGKDMDGILEKCTAAGINTVITTEKDVMRSRNGGFPKLADLFAGSPAVKQKGIELLTMSIDFEISKNEEAIVAGLRSLFNS